MAGDAKESYTSRNLQRTVDITLGNYTIRILLGKENTCSACLVQGEVGAVGTVGMTAGIHIVYPVSLLIEDEQVRLKNCIDLLSYSVLLQLSGRCTVI